MDTASKCGSADSTSSWSDLEWTLRIGSIVLLTCLAALFAGLTLGYMSLDTNGLQIVIDAGDDPDATPEEKKNAAYARKIAPIRKDGHLLLTTMLYGNVGINSIMAIAMADMTNGVIGFLLTTVILVIFGELIPQALCSRHPLSIGGKSVPIVKFFMVIFYIAARPVASILDYCIGHEIGAVYSRTEMSKMLEIHVKQKMLDADETDIMKGAMYFKRKAVASVMTPIDRVYMLPVTTVLDLETIKMIYHTGYSRIPVYGKDRNDVVGLIFVKDLIFADPDEKTTLLNFVHVFGRGVHRVWPDSTLGEVMQAFKAGRTHLALVHDVNNDGPGDPYYETKGVVTLEDIVEEILQDKIYDESDEIDPETHRKNRLSHRSYDPGMSHLLEGKQEVKYLARPEAEALAKHLVANDPVFSTVDNNNTPLSESHLAALILTKCPVLEFHTSDAPHADLFVEHKVTNHALIVLHGHVRVTAHDGEVTTAGLWSVHGANALLVPDGSYESDITVEVPSDVYVRCLRISHLDFQATLYPMQIASDASVLQLRRVEIKKPRPYLRLEAGSEHLEHVRDALGLLAPGPARTTLW
ncbi:hypothetical protein SDRG_06261 [Saprolegnia diclina VS20]|uniref:CNNM transmembrane domain-containing protein n=1 Tax=Saprolegnia diclina (strain VS20) TaxID=1156394 RepID=T0QQH3_SAPDV|nr:hypothetical protein SDRG_06261 [Saprolegnia diclina VS20]EQC36145.1 hypothetical protein SDRG_06261 [Saprolegnia diclina VS20]|eukprot:XP_008610251.1 hypothetical protein SDRG_06261 [Saprolegnia diclina VS20]